MMFKPSPCPGNPNRYSSDDTDGIACWLIATDYHEKSFLRESLDHTSKQKSCSTSFDAAIGKLYKYHLLILDDFSYVTSEGAETSVLFELIGARYENRSVLVIANEPFSAWGKIFGSDAMAVAAVDRLVHRSHIFELNVESYRRRAAAEARRAAAEKQGEGPEPA